MKKIVKIFIKNFRIFFIFYARSYRRSSTVNIRKMSIEFPGIFNSRTYSDPAKTTSRDLNCNFGPFDLLNTLCPGLNRRLNQMVKCQQQYLILFIWYREMRFFCGFNLVWFGTVLVSYGLLGFILQEWSTNFFKQQGLVGLSVRWTGQVVLGARVGVVGK